MGHGKNSKQKNQKVGLGQEPKETREQRRRRIAEEAKAREACMKMLPYVAGAILFLILVFGLYVHSLPLKIPETMIDPSSQAGGYEQASFLEDIVSEEPNPDVLNLDGDSL